MCSDAWNCHKKADATAFLRTILPYLMEKKQQAEIVLNMEPGSGVEVKEQLRRLKGNYTAERTQDLATTDRSDETDEGFERFLQERCDLAPDAAAFAAEVEQAYRL